MSDPQTVLVVDDDLEIVRAACMRLRAAGYKALEATDGTSGVAAAIAARPDLILLDVRMPRKDGLAVLSELKHRADTKHIPVVMLSASIVDQEAGLDAGARFFIRKPYSGATLMQAVRAALAVQAKAEPPNGDEATPFEEHDDDVQANFGGG
ncbi:MAG TPA: response regulator [Pirellulales bacterium]|nr:response regulator [Pirellulales bacterium]